MLTRLEFEQLKAAIECMNTYTVNDHRYINKNNVLALIQRFTKEYAEGINDDTTGE